MQSKTLGTLNSLNTFFLKLQDFEASRRIEEVIAHVKVTYFNQDSTFVDPCSICKIRDRMCNCLKKTLYRERIEKPLVEKLENILNKFKKPENGQNE